ncbi:MAG: hypothetical protein KatS3mg129_1371 [Leptospiraceae bacterium]|nr:MAG: hypothetical protein KatS3mg129_1371 [Leptospiraceae bacterium]
MLAIRPKIRMVIHFLDNKDLYKRHGDLFIDFPKYDKLITFEVDAYYLEILKKQYNYYYLILQDKNLERYINPDVPILESINDIYQRHSNCDIIKVPLKRKEDHRREYLTKVGEVNGKGKIENFTFSYLSGIVFGDSDFLIIIDYD